MYAIFFSLPDQYGSPLSLSSEFAREASSTLVGVSYLALDSAVYLAAGINYEFAFPDSPENFVVALGQYSNFALFVIARVASTLLPEAPYLFVTLINHVFLLLTLNNYIKVCRRSEVCEKTFFVLFGGNLLILFSVYTLNKEIIGLYIVSEVLLMVSSPKKHLLRLLVVAVLAAATRPLNLLFLAIAVMNKYFRLNPLYYLLFMAGVILPITFYATDGLLFGRHYGTLDQAAQNFDQQSAALTTAFFQYISVPFGYLLQYPVVLLVNILSPILNPAYWQDLVSVVNLSQILLQVSSGLFAALLLATVLAGGFRGFLFGPGSFFLFYTMISCLLPLSQHRYLLPVYPVIVLAYLLRRRAPRSLARLDARKTANA